jgi:hypothetical protein
MAQQQLSEWLDVMLGEIARKQDEAARAAAEQARRAAPPPTPTPEPKQA